MGPGSVRYAAVNPPVYPVISTGEPGSVALPDVLCGDQCREVGIGVGIGSYGSVACCLRKR